MSQEALAERGGLARIDVQRVESGTLKGGSARLQNGLAKALGISPFEVAALLQGRLSPEGALAAMKKAEGSAETGMSVNIAAMSPLDQAILSLRIDGEYTEAELLKAANRARAEGRQEMTARAWKADLVDRIQAWRRIRESFEPHRERLGLDEDLRPMVLPSVPSKKGGGKGVA